MYGDRVRGVDVRPSLLLMADLAPPLPWQSCGRLDCMTCSNEMFCLIPMLNVIKVTLELPSI